MPRVTTSREIDDTTASWSYAELWDRYPIPARPDDEELAIESKVITASSLNPAEIKLMVLGSTIEYRSLCKQLGISPYVVDFSRENFESLTAFSKEEFTNEHFVAADWLDTAYENFFDYILGHRPFNVIRHDQVLRLFRCLYAALKPGGVCFCRGIVQFPDGRDSFDQALKQWAQVKQRPYRLFSYLEVPLYLACSDAEGYLDYLKARAVMKQAVEDGLVSAADYRDIQPLISMPAGTKFRSLVSKHELESIFDQVKFRQVEWLFTSHPFTQSMPIIKLTK